MSEKIKDYVLKLLGCFPDYSLFQRMENASAGFVTWSATPPVGVGYQTHKFSILDAFETASRFLQHEFFTAWIVAGPAVLSVVKTLPAYVPKPEHSGGKLHFAGMLGARKVYAYEGAPDPSIFWVGSLDKCCVGKII